MKCCFDKGNIAVMDGWDIPVFLLSTFTFPPKCAFEECKTKMHITSSVSLNIRYFCLESGHILF